MAGRLRVSYSTTMKDSTFRSDCNIDCCDNGSQGHNEDGIQRDPDFVEDRFRVDRKKLEHMLQVHGEHTDESAEDFFQRVMDETNTQITWPSKLKIGAKSKKDPHIKVVGMPEDVRSAKDRIMTVLDTKSNRVTLKMDVSHTEHSHVIGKGGNNIKRVMQGTGCHIHFPDSNRGNNVQEKSNQVSIAGQPTGVESARQQIRELLPLVYMFELPMGAMLQPLPDVSSPAIQQLQQNYNVTVSFRQRPRMYVTTIIVRGSVFNAISVKEATSRLMEQLTGNISCANMAVSMQLEIAPQHHLFMIGQRGMNVKQIMQRTGATIHFPDPNNVTPLRKGTVFITGSIESVYLAREQLIGCLPLVLMFDVKEDVEVDQTRIGHLMEQLDVFISVKPKPKQPSKSVIVKSIERNATNMYMARLTLLGQDRDDSSYTPCQSNNSSRPTSPPTNGLGLAGLGLLSQNLLNITTTNSLLLLNGHCGGSNLVSPHPSPGSTSPCSHWVPPPPGIYSPMMMVTPPSVFTNATQNGLNMLTQCNGLNKELSQNGALIRVPTPSDRVFSPDPSSNNSSVNSPSHSPCDSPPLEMSAPPTTVDIASSETADEIVKMISQNTSPSNSGHTLDLLGLSKPTNSPLSQSLFMDSPVPPSHLLNGDRSSESGGDSDSSDKRAPGIERKNSCSLFGGPHPLSVEYEQKKMMGTSVDYEQKKLMATKAMQKKPIGESRTPTNVWAGLGFSKSMPESAIRECLYQNNMKYCGNHMATTFEHPSPEMNGDGDVDRDPWKDSAKAPVNPAPGEYPSPRRRYDYSMNSSNHLDGAILPPKSVNLPKTDLAELFSKMGLGKYSDLFQQQEIDLATFRTLTDEDLKELGITTFGARRKMLLAIADMNKRQTLFSATPGSNNPFRENGEASLRTRWPDLASLSGRW
ncbi:protein bicaudal C homolog 1-B-like isoform X2 [Liolophura sinensis]|uniref:protein bicaudal C homolog 1-B-like isoform X2 n=1 Tax=Liolophura sinensis TaxID=3198878 RepID=UPI00315989A5